MQSPCLRALAFPLCLCLAACASDPDDPAPAELGTDSSSTGAVEPGPDASSTGAVMASTGDEHVDGSDSSTGDAPQLVPVDIDRAWIERIEGPWEGPVETPYITIPQFPLDFAWQADGRLHANVSDGMETSFDFDFAHDGEHWIFTERGALPGGMVQSYALYPVAIDGDRVRWVYLDEPELLVVELEVDAEEFRMEVTVRGVTHASMAHTRG